MKKQSKEEGKATLVSWLEAHNFELDRFGHYTKTLSSGTKRRFKMQANSCRIETQREVNGQHVWFKYRTAHYTDIYLTINDKLSGFNR